MLRTYVLMIVGLGVLASFVGRLPHTDSSSSAQRQDVINISDATPQNGGQRGGQSINELEHSIELTRDQNGYFFADVRINGAPVHMLIDTGATGIALSRDDAHLAGIPTSIGMNDVVGVGADGAVKGEEVKLDRVTLGDKTVEGLPAIVLNSGGQSLLGQSFLSQFASVKIEGDKMVLR